MSAEAELRNAIERVSRSLSRHVLDGRRAMVSTSSMFPSGTTVAVQVEFDGATCLVNDMGNAQLEAELLGASDYQFTRHGRTIAEQYGIGFDKNAFFVVQVPLENLEGAIRIVSSASCKAAMMVENSINEQRERNDRDLMIDKMIEYFGKDKVERDIEIKGASQHPWHFLGRVRGDHPLVFDCVTPYAASISAAHTKFDDISRIPDRPNRAVGLHDPAAFKEPQIRLLQRVAPTIPINSSRAEYQELLHAA